jgi:hypothetical protein
MEGDKTYFGLDNPTDMEIALHSFNDLVFPAGFGTDPYWKNENKRMVIFHVRYVFGSFFRKQLNTCFPLWRLPSDLKGTEAEILINAEVELWQSTLRLISSINSKYAAFNLKVHPIMYLAELARESSLILANLPSKSIFGDLKLTDFRRIIQIQNRKLRELKENPFDKQKTFTYELIHKAINCERTFCGFPTDEWEAMIRSREKLSTVLRKSKLSNIEKTDHRGKWIRSKSRQRKNRLISQKTPENFAQ